MSSIESDPDNIGKKKSILLAEDMLNMATLEKEMLESVGYSVMVVRDGVEALKIVGREKFDLIITDIIMPNMDGLELTENLKKDKIYKDIPIIIVTSKQGDADKRRGLEAGAQAYIVKGKFMLEELLTEVRHLIG